MYIFGQFLDFSTGKYDILVRLAAQADKSGRPDYAAGNMVHGRRHYGKNNQNTGAFPRRISALEAQNGFVFIRTDNLIVRIFAGPICNHLVYYAVYAVGGHYDHRVHLRIRAPGCNLPVFGRMGRPREPQAADYRRGRACSHGDVYPRALFPFRS